MNVLLGEIVLLFQALAKLTIDRRMDGRNRRSPQHHYKEKSGGGAHLHLKCRKIFFPAGLPHKLFFE